MRILHILNHINKTGNGIVNVAVDLACLQSKEGHVVAVVSNGGEYETLLKGFSVEHYLLDQTRKPFNMLKSIYRFKQIIKNFNPDIIHAHMMTGAVLGKMYRGFSKYFLVTTVHNEWQKSSIVMKIGDRVIAVSESVKNSMLKQGVKDGKLRVVLNGTLGSPRSKSIDQYSPYSLDRPSIITVAGMYKRKGILELLEAFEEVTELFPEVSLYVIGEGPDRLIFEEKAKQSKSSNRIHFEGFQPEPQRYLLSGDIFVLASLQEPFGLVLTEAREAGCAIVASNVGGIPEVLDSGEAGILVNRGDPKDLALALISLLENKNILEEIKEKL